MPSAVPDWLAPLREDLLTRLAQGGLRVDALVRLQVEAWLDAAGQRGWLDATDPNCAKGPLRALIGKSAREQAAFDAVFEAWAASWAASQAVTPAPDSETPAQPARLPAENPPPLPRKPPARRWLWPALLSLLFFIAIFRPWQFLPDWGDSSSPAKDPAPAASAPAASAVVTAGPEIELPASAVTPGQAEVQLAAQPLPPWLFGLHPAYYWALALLGGGMAYAVRRQRQQYVSRISSRENLREQEVFARQLLPVAGARREALRRAARELRRPRPTAQRRLDLLASVRATAQRAGLFTPVHRQQRETPEFLFLIDRLRGGDQQAHWAAELARDLAAEGVLLHLYEYDRDPRWVAPLRTQRSAAPTPTQRYRPLATLAARHAGQGLVLLGDGLGCLDPVAGQLQAWVKDSLAPWPRRVLMTPRPTDSWGPAEDLLAGEGQPAHLPSFLVLPMQIDAWPAAAHWLCQGELAELAVLPGAPADYPALLRDDPQRWLAGGAPADGELLALVGQLRAWLGPTAYTWLAAGAAYPHHSAELTAYLAHALDDALDNAPGNAPPGGSDAPSVPATDARLFEARLIAIAQLPWSRHGLMPDWLRRALLLSLPPPVRIQVRTALTRLFLTAADERAAAAGWSLGVVATDAARTGTPAWWRRLRRRIGLGGVVESEPADSPLRDVIYLGMLRGDFDRELSLAAPAAFARAARAGQGTRLSWNPLRWVAAALLSLWFVLRIGGWQVVASTAVGFLLPQTPWMIALFAVVWVLVVVLPMSVMRGKSWRWLPPSAGVVLGLLLGWLFPTASPLVSDARNTLFGLTVAFILFAIGVALYQRWQRRRASVVVVSSQPGAEKK